LRVISRASTLEEAARILDIESSTLWRKRKRYEEANTADARATAGARSPVWRAQ